MLAVLTAAVALALPQGQGVPPDSIRAATLWGPTLESMELTAPPALSLNGVHGTGIGAERAEGASPSSIRKNPEEAPDLVEYSDAYFTRLTIHRWASYLTLPLFAGQYVVGQKLMNGDGSDNLRGIHGALAGTLAGLFAVNTVTGVWNLYDSRKDSEGRTRRTIHSVLMLLADAGFVATAALANENESEHGYYGGSSNNNAHRNMAIASMGTALFSYAIMLPLPIIGRN